jgi:hypothetical protein
MNLIVRDFNSNGGLKIAYLCVSSVTYLLTYKLTGVIN